MRPAAAVPALAALALLGGCESHITVDLTDGPTDGAQEVVLDIESITLLRSGGSTVTLELDDPGPVDLLAFRNGNTYRLVSEREVDPGRLTGIALDFAATGSFVTRDDGSEVTINPPATRTYADIDVTIEDWGSVDLLVDLNARFSLVDTGSGSYDLVPVVRALQPFAGGTATGLVPDAVVEGTACAQGRAFGAGVGVYAFSGAGATPDDYSGQAGLVAADNVEPDAVSGGYRYELHFLPAGDYTLALTCQADADDPATDDAVTFVSSIGVIVPASSTVQASFP